MLDAIDVEGLSAIGVDDSQMGPVIGGDHERIADHHVVPDDPGQDRHG